MEIRGSGHLEVDNALDSRGREVLHIDLSRVDHVNLYGIMVMAIAVMDASNKGHQVTFRPPSSSPSACNFMSRLGFDDFVRDAGSIDCNFDVTSQQEERDVLVTLRTFRTSGDLQPLQDLLWNRLDKIATPQAKTALGEALWELGANVTEHSESPGIVAAVVQGAGRRESHIVFAIGDAGIGIRRSFWKGGRRHPASDHQAIGLAIQYLVSSKAEQGRGQGLTETINQAVGLDGRVLIRTGEARKQVSAGRSLDVPQVHKNSSVPRLPGTLVVVDVPSR